LKLYFSRVEWRPKTRWSLFRFSLGFRAISAILPSLMAKKKPKLPRWQEPPAHPVLERLPMMDEAQIIELAGDIEANGQHMPIFIWVDDCNDPGGEGPFLRLSLMAAVGSKL
jgi:hypothetical protein